MPLITLRVNEDISKVVQSDIVGRLVEITNTILRKERAVIVVNMQISTSSEKWFVAESISSERVFSLCISITRGTNTELEKSTWIDSAYKIIRSTFLKNETVNYITIEEVDSDCWGYNGLTQKYRRSIK